MILYIAIAVALIINIINPRILWRIDSWKYKNASKAEPSPLYLFLCRGLSLLGVVILIMAVYFRPMNLTDLVDRNSKLRITQQYMGVKNGEPYIDSEGYNELSEEQLESIFTLFQQYTYQRTYDTLFSDGSLSNLGERMIIFFVYEDDELVNTLIVSDTGRISVNDKSYIMQNSPELIRRVSEII